MGFADFGGWSLHFDRIRRCLIRDRQPIGQRLRGGGHGRVVGFFTRGERNVSGLAGIRDRMIHRGRNKTRLHV